MDSPAELNLAEWEEKLIGKEIIPAGGQVTNPAKQFAEDDIKSAIQRYRILKPNTMTTMDFWPERLNIHVEGDSMIVTKVTSG